MSRYQGHARLPNCLMAVDAVDGGRWLSPLQQSIYRNFLKTPASWSSYKSRMSDTAYFSLGDDVTIDIEFEYNGDYAGNSGFFSVSGVGNAPFSFLQYNNGNFYWYSNLFVLKDGAQFVTQNISKTKLPNGKHTLHLELLSTTRQMGFSLDGEPAQWLSINTVQYDAATSLINTLAPESNFDGSIQKLVIKNLTKNLVIWQAETTDLYSAIYPYPSAVERNFATETGKFYDVGTTVTESEMLNDDFEFVCTFTNTSDKEVVVFYVGAYNNLFGIYQYTSTRVGFFTSLCTGAGYDGYVTIGVNPFTNNLNTKHMLVIRVIGTKVTFILDDQVLYENAAITRKTSAFNPAGVSAGAGYLHDVKITNLTKNKVVWSYPTWPEKTRLLTYENITTANGAFVTPDVTKARYIATQLDFRNRATDFTMVVKGKIPAHSVSGKAYVSSLISQGNVYWGDVDRCVCGIWVTEDYRGETPIFNVAASPTVKAVVTEDFFNRTHVIALTATTMDNRSRLYIDGVLVATSAVARPALPLSAATLNPSDNSVIKVNAQTDSFYYSEPEINAFMVFDGALTDFQIAALTDAMNANATVTSVEETTVVPANLGIWNESNQVLALGNFAESNQVTGFGNWQA